MPEPGHPELFLHRMKLQSSANNWADQEVDDYENA